MAITTDRIKQALEVTGELLAAAGTLWVALNKSGSFIAPWFAQFGMPRPLAAALAWGIPIAAFLFLLVLAWRATISRSRIFNPDRFELSAKHRDQIKGRDQDIRDLLELIAAYPLVFLVGESGSGKSALVEAGLLPDLCNEGRFVPVLVRRYGSGWESGPLKETMLALWEALPEEQRTTLGIPVRPSPATITLDLFTSTLAAINARLGRQPLLVFDQFDDYQLLHRQEFTTADGAWRDAAALESANPFWHAVGAGIRNDLARCLIITRSDAAAGLESARFIEDIQTRARDLFRLRGEFLWPLLDSLAPETADPPVVSDPGNGWSQLKAVLAEELQIGGLVLPQQVRTVALGLRSLSYLTVGEYRRAGGAAGLEALYVTRAISDCARQCRVGADRVRTVLRAMVETAGKDSEAKTISRSANALGQYIADADTLQNVLSELARSEIVRRVPNAESDENEWQLDHDYLAQAVLHEERQQNRHAALLRDSAAAWRASAGDWRMRWRALLPLKTQVQLAWARIKPQSTFRYGTEAGFARLSLFRSVHVLFAVAVIAVGGWWYQIVKQAEGFVDALQPTQVTGNTPIRLWVSGDLVRDEVATQVLAQPDHGERVTDGWMAAVAGIDTARANDVANRVLAAFEGGNLSPIATAVGNLGPYLEESTAQLFVAILIKRINDVERRYPPDALVMLQPVAGTNGLSAAASAAVQRFDIVIPLTLQSHGNTQPWMKATSECADLEDVLPILDVKSEQTLAHALSLRLTNGDPTLYWTDCVRLYGTLGARAQHRKENIDLFAAALRKYVAAATNYDLAYDEAMRALSRVDPTGAQQRVETLLRDARESFQSDCYQQEAECAQFNSKMKFSTYADIVETFAASLPPQSAAAVAEDLIHIFRNTAHRGYPGPGRNDYAWALTEALAALTPRLNASGAASVVRSLRQSIIDETFIPLLDTPSVFGQVANWPDGFNVLAGLAPQLNQASAALLIDDLLVTPTHESSRGYDGKLLARTLGLLASRQDPERAVRIARAAMERLLAIKDGEYRAELLKTLGRSAFALPESELASLSESLMASLFDADGGGFYTPAALSAAMGGTCQALAAFPNSRTLGIKCMIVAASFPIGSGNEVRRIRYSWEDIRRFARLTKTSGVSAILEWAQDKEGIPARDLRPEMLLAHVR